MKERDNIVMSLNGVGVQYPRQGKLYKRKQKGFWALSDISFELYHGEVLGVIGRNGVGKSTLLRVLAGVIKPDKGVYTNYGYRSSLLALQAGFLPHLSGRKNAILSGLLLGMKYREIEEVMGEIIEFSELDDFIDEPISTYSSGMKARLGFSVAFHSDPDVILVDEVLGVGDAEFQKKSSAIMREKIKSDKTIVLVSHAAPVIEALCDRAILIEQGGVRAVGNPKDILRTYNR